MEVSVPQTNPYRQDPAHSRDLVEAPYIRTLAQDLYRFDLRDKTRLLSELDLESQQRYINDAILVAIMRDPKRVRVALYAGANELVPSGLACLDRKNRTNAVVMFGNAFKVMRQFIAKELPPAVMTHLTRLAETDARAEVH